jgi:2-dehydro-3-deoxyphosphogluconate aldolase/(4S)-4-hydroxy-2-oxoglutarate aldolase
MALEVFRQLVPWVEKECPELSIGAGTVLDEETANQFMDGGADFIVSPVFDKATAKACRKRNVPYIPGCFTPTEMYKAYNVGSAVVKLFPGGTVGPDYVRHVLAPLPHLRLLITGGISFDRESVRSWFDAGSFALGIGSSVFTRERISKKDFPAITEEIGNIVKY